MSKRIGATVLALLLIAAAVALFTGAPAASAPDDKVWHFCACELPHKGHNAPFRYNNTDDMRVRGV